MPVKQKEIAKELYVRIQEYISDILLMEPQCNDTTLHVLQKHVNFIIRQWELTHFNAYELSLVTFTLTLFYQGDTINMKPSHDFKLLYVGKCPAEPNDTVSYPTYNRKSL
jgi:hypothetical protein